ncbi:hypothetical protein FIBSPDRAFT_856355 [Athelia psychrophila]|uniref:Uncharacterized protein n=1 Tax=Athelia psychrophila TaxID=1759441 RepID=A0A166NGG8_9AGAM|nr:hypothetical protein FIBSPDRAFT_856355 [Fibularhizoctonia sp. CBS 109695]
MPAEGMPMPTVWDIYTAPRGGVNEEGMAEWAHIKPFAAVLDRAQEQSQMVVAVTIAMPSTRCPLRVMGKVGGEDELDTDSWGEETENAQNAQHYYDIGLVRLPWPAVPLCCDSDDSDAV